MYDNPLNATPNRPDVGKPAAPPSGQPTNFYAPPIEDVGAEPVWKEEGSYPMGFVVGFMFSLLGLFLVWIFGKSGTTRGAVHGCLLRLGLGFALFAIAGVFM